MTESFFQRVIVPVANREDAAATADALASHLESGHTVIAVNVIEKAGGAPDKASVEQRKQFAKEIFDILTTGLEGTESTLETEILYGTDIATAIIESAHERAATAIVFTPRGGSRWQKLFLGDVTHKLVANSDVPILVLPDQPEADS